MDHPHALIGELVCQKKMFYRQHAVNSFFKRISTRIGFTFPILERKHKHLNHSVMIRPSFGASERDSRDALKQIVSNNNVFALMFGMLTDKTLFKAALVLLFEKLGIGIYTNRFLVSLQLEQTQLDGSCVELTGSFDDKGRAIPKVVRKFGNELIDDIENIKDLMSDLCVDQSVFNRYDTDEENFVSGSHHSGTCRLGLSKHDSVVDINLKYHEINNLYVCDASIFPKIGNVNLSLSIGLFAIRLSKLLHKLSS
jgi:choline dehydrogenase-like flavoprotein